MYLRANDERFELSSHQRLLGLTQRAQHKQRVRSGQTRELIRTDLNLLVRMTARFPRGQPGDDSEFVKAFLL